MSALAGFTDLLKDSMGLDVSSIGTSAVERAVLERQRICQIGDPSEYWEHVRHCESELQALIETVVVTETWFFRDPTAFGALVEFARREWLPAHPEGVLRILSLPCASGEEPYSIAMALLDAGMSPARFSVHAVDISDRMLQLARQGVYGRGSFRGTNLSFRDRHFKPTAHGYRVSDRVRARVTFEQGNLCSPSLLPGAEMYDVIFCRNVMIYFDRPTQQAAIAQLVRLLTPTGLLFVGPSETGIAVDRALISARVPMAFALRKATTREPAQSRSAQLGCRTARGRTTVQLASQGSTPLGPVETPPVDFPNQAGSTLAEVMRLADLGQLADARARCEDHMRRHGPSSNGLYVLGLVNDATGNRADADRCYRQALFLNPRHHEALIHLALLMETERRPDEARLLRRRASRVEAEGRS